MTKLDFDRLKNSILGFSAIVGDERGDRAFAEAVQAANGVAWRFVNTMPRGKYGDSIDLILVFFSIQGEHDWFEIPKTRKLGPYAAKQRTMKFNVPIRESELKLLEGTQKNRDTLFADVFTSLAGEIERRKFPPNFAFDRNLFLSDLNTIIAELSK